MKATVTTLTPTNKKIEAYGQTYRVFFCEAAQAWRWEPEGYDRGIPFSHGHATWEEAARHALSHVQPLR